MFKNSNTGSWYTVNLDRGMEMVILAGMAIESGAKVVTFKLRLKQRGMGTIMKI